MGLKFAIMLVVESPMLVTALLPSWPCWPLPKHLRRPPVSNAQVCFPPPLMATGWRLTTAATTQASLVETLQVAAKLTGDKRFIHDADGRPFFGRATHFISYFWAAPFGRLGGALEMQRVKSDGGDSGAPSYFWIDIFCVGAYFPRVQ